MYLNKQYKLNNCLLWCSYVAWFSGITLTFLVQYILCRNHRQLDLVCVRISEFPKISALSQKLVLVRNQLEKLGEVYLIDFLIVI